VFVAGFLGSPRINLVAPELLGLAPSPGTLAGLRPEALAVAHAGAGVRPADTLEARVYVVEPMGAETWVTVVRDGARLTGHAGAEFTALPGAPVWLTFDPAALLRFPQSA